MTARTRLRVALASLVYPAILFGTAGTWRWPGAWVFLGVQVVMMTYLLRWLARHDPALLAERMKRGFQPDQPLWDKVLLVVLAVLWLGWICVPGLDAMRYGWTSMAWPWQVLGLVLHGLGWWGFVLVHRANTFLAPIVRVQVERGQRVIDTGPYAVVRHPMYAAFLLWMPGAGLVLGSWWATALAPLLCLPLIVRTALEDAWLARDLEGYEAYRARVRYRLVPGVW